MTELERIRKRLLSNHELKNQEVNDVERLVKALEKCREQRDGFMNNYHAACGLTLDARVEIHSDCNAELESILRGES